MKKEETEVRGWGTAKPILKKIPKHKRKCFVPNCDKEWESLALLTRDKNEREGDTLSRCHLCGNYACSIHRAGCVMLFGPLREWQFIRLTPTPCDNCIRQFTFPDHFSAKPLKRPGKRK